MLAGRGGSQTRTRIALRYDLKLRLIAETPPAARLDNLKPTNLSVRIDVHTDDSSLVHLVPQGGLTRRNTNHPLSKAQENANRKKSKIRARVEHVFGTQQTSPGGRIIRTIGIARARAKIGLQNLAYNIRRLVTLERMAAA